MKNANTPAQNRHETAQKSAAALSEKLVPEALVLNDTVEVWRFKNPENVSTAFDVSITRFGTSVHGTIGHLAFDVGLSYGLPFLAGDDVGYYMYSKVAEEFKVKEFDWSIFKNHLLNDSRALVEKISEQVDLDDADKGAVSELDLTGLIARIEEIKGTLDGMKNTPDVKKARRMAKDVQQVLEDVRSGRDLPESADSAHRWYQKRQEALVVSDTWEYSFDAPSWSTLYKLYVVNACAKKAVEFKSALKAKESMGDAPGVQAAPAPANSSPSVK